MESAAPAAGDSSDLPLAPAPEEPSPVESSSSSSAAAVSPGPAAPPKAREVAAAMEAVERDAAAIADSYAALFASLRAALSNVTSTSAENMECLSDVVGRLQESALEASSKGNKYINSCLRLNEEMRGLESLAMQLQSVAPASLVNAYNRSGLEGTCIGIGSPNTCHAFEFQGICKVDCTSKREALFFHEMEKHT